MKKSLAVLVVLIAVMLIGAGSAMALISGSKHDLSTTAAGGTTEICVFCHTPHGALVSQGPIWNRSSLTTNFTMYSIQSSTSVALATNITSISKACMSCHDGVTSLNAVVNGPGNPDVAITANRYGANFVTGMSNIGNSGGDLSNDHPIGVVYDTNKGSLRAPTTVATGPVKITGLNLVQGTNLVSMIGCESCHSDVHGSVNPSLFTKVLPLGTYGNDSSRMCLTCHQK